MKGDGESAPGRRNCPEEALKEDPALCPLLQYRSVLIDWHCQSGLSCALAGVCDIPWGRILRKFSAAKSRPLVYPWVPWGLLEDFGVLPYWALEVTPRDPGPAGVMPHVSTLSCPSSLISGPVLSQGVSWPSIPDARSVLEELNIAPTYQDLGI